MGLFSKKENKKNYVISLDIGTEYVKALIFKVEGDEGYVLGYGKQHQKLSDMQGGAVTDIAGVISNIDKALAEAAGQAGVMPDQTIIGIAGELVKGITTTVDYVRPKADIKISVPELKEIIEKVQKKTFEKARSTLAWETGYSEVDVKLVNSAVVDVRIDGYRVTNPIGFPGKNISVGVFNAFAPLVHLSPIQTIADELGLDLLSVAAEPYAVARCMGLEESSEFSAIFLDLGGGTTDIAVVRAGGVEGTKMFGLGGRSFTRRLSNSYGISFEQAEEKKIKYSKGALTEAETKQIRKIFEADIEVWLSGVELTLQEFSHSSRTDTDILPSKILLCGGASLLPDICDILKESSWWENLPFAKKPVVQYIKPSDVASIKDKTGLLSNPQHITPMALANLAIDLAGEETVLAGTLRKVVASLKY